MKDSKAQSTDPSARLSADHLKLEPTAQPAYELNGQPVERSAFYAVACDPDRSVAVEACAGAGKTWMLVARIVRALLNGCPPHEILAITFTKKAAGEMRQRLMEGLRDFAQQSPDQLQIALIGMGIEHYRLSGLDGLLSKLYKNVLHNGRPVQIRTFHSWFAALLGTAPIALLQAQGLPTQYELLEDDQQVVDAVWRPFLAAVAADASLRADYEAVVMVHGRSQTHKALEAGLSKRVEFMLADEHRLIDHSVPRFDALWPDLQGWDYPADALSTDAARQRWLGWAQALGAESNATPQKAANAVIDAWMDDFQADAHPQVTGEQVNGVQIATAQLQQGHQASHSQHAQKGAAKSMTQRLQQLRKAFFVAKEDRLSKHLEKFPAAQEAELELQMLCKASQQHEAWSFQQRMARLMRCMLDVFAQVKRQHGWVDMNGIERAALVMLSDPALSGWVQERLDARVRHLLIDEFQDTNPLQWQALHAWLSSYVGAGGGRAPSVFVVGDPKQSIYRFRRAEPQVFIAAQQFVLHGLGGDLLSCDHTRRNAPAVIAAVNHAMLEAQAQHAIAGYRSHTTESTQAHGGVFHLPLVAQPAQDAAACDVGTPEGAALAWRDSLTIPRDEPEISQRQREAAQVADWVAQRIASGTPAQQIMVLARKRVSLGWVQEALLARHIPCVQSEKNNLADAPEVQDIVALLDALVSPGHNLSLARALKSPLFACSDDDLTQLVLLRRQLGDASNQQSGDKNLPSWFEVLQNKELLPLQLQAVMPVLDHYQRLLASLPPHDALHAIYTHGDVLARFASAAPAVRRASVVANLRALLAAALQQDGGRYLTPYAWVRAIRQTGMRAPSRVNEEAVQLLTIHGAKGLEADCVVLIDTHAPPAKAETMGVLVDWPGEEATPRLFAFVSSESKPPPSVADAVEQEKQARLREEINSLYVAMTRARNTLVISANEPARGDNPSSWWRRLQPITELTTAPITEPTTEPTTQAARGVGTGVHIESDDPGYTLYQMPDWTPVALAGTKAGDVASDSVGEVLRAEDTSASRLGQAMHQLLEQATADTVAACALAAGDTSPSQCWPPQRVAQLSRDFKLTPAAAQQAAQLAHTILTGEGAWAWNAALIAQAFNEVPLSYQGQSLRIDRLVQGQPGTAYEGWWVLDYKSATQAEQQTALHAQLQRYRLALQAQYPNDRVRAALLTGNGRMVLMDG